MDYPGRTKTFLGGETCLSFSLGLSILQRWVAHVASSMGRGFICWIWMVFYLSSPPPLAQDDWSILFPRNSLWLLAGQYPASGLVFISKGLRRYSLCPADGHFQNCCCLMPFYISSACPPAGCFLVDRGERMSSFTFICMWSPLHHLVAGEENRNSSLGSRTLQSHYQLDKLWPVLDFRRDLYMTL